MLQYATDYKMVAVGNDTNGTTLYQKVKAGNVCCVKFCMHESALIKQLPLSTGG